MDGKGKRVQSVEKAMLLLDCFWRARKSFSLAELAAQTGWAKSTIHALLSSMTGSALVEQDPQTGKYQLGYHAFELGCVVLERWPVRPVAGHYMQKITERTGESLYLGMRCAYRRDTLDGQLKTELLTALQPAFARISNLGIRYSALPGHTLELAGALNDVLTEKWRKLRGIEIVSVGVSSVKASEEDEQMIKQLQRNAALQNPTMAAATLVGAQAAAMQAAAANEAAGPAMAFMGANMAGQMGGMNAQSLFQMGAQQQAQQARQAAPGSWTCACGHTATGNFCPQCGAKKPADDAWQCTCGETVHGNFCPACGSKRPEHWTCACGQENTGRFCTQCGAPKPVAHTCAKCGWKAKDGEATPKFCPSCGTPFSQG